jgi:ABC-2 type transport system ATP-binding protein
MRNVTVRYQDVLALDDLSLSLPAGEVFGYIGPNGAGKSTTMKVLASLLRPTSGSATIAGHDCSREGDAIRRIVGYMPDFLGVYDDLTVDEYLQFFAGAFGVARRKRRTLVDGVLELTDLTGKRNAMVESLSRGMQQRLGVARVLIHDPKVLLLDEPASGLDPRARIEMRSLLGELRAMGKTIIVSSHILSELHEMCTQIGIIERGRLLFAGSMEDAFRLAGAGERIEIRLEHDAKSFVVTLDGDERVASVKHNEHRLIVELAPGEHGHHFLIERLVGAGARIAAFEPRAQRLEDVFLRITKGAVQ